MSISMTTDFEEKRPTSHQMPVPVQVLSTLLYAGFAISVTTIAMTEFVPAGVILAIVLGWRGGFAPGNWSRQTQPVEDAIKSLIPTSQSQSSGNASFDAYRTDMLDRLETEQVNFENFLGRLRDAKDQSEFEKFMDDRAAKISHDETT